MNDLLVVLPDSIDKRLLDELTRMTGCTAPILLARRPGVVHLLYQYRPGHPALERFLEMVTSACDSRYGPDRRNDVADRWLRGPEA